jgi:hypothetical protein
MDEFVTGYEASGWQGIGAPKNTPTNIVDRLNKEINAIVADPQVKVRFLGMGFKPTFMTSAEFVGQGDPGGQHQAGMIRAIKHPIREHRLGPEGVSVLGLDRRLKKKPSSYSAMIRSMART